jgi:hypothetical protein
VLGAEHSCSRGILGFFTTREACTLRLVCRELKEAVTAFPWLDDEMVVIKGPKTTGLRKWAACFPRARTVCIEREGATEEEAAILAALPRVVFKPSTTGDAILGDLGAWRAAHPLALFADVSGRLDLRDADFAHLRGIRTLRLERCWQQGQQGGLTAALFGQIGDSLSTVHVEDCSLPFLVSCVLRLPPALVDMLPQSSVVVLWR